MKRAGALLTLLLALCAFPGCDRRGPLPGQTAPVASGTEAAGLRFIERITGGAKASDPLPLIVGIHGRGGDPERFGRALAALSIPARVILPYGPDALGEGFTWFPDWNDDDELAVGTRRAADRLAAMLSELTATRPTIGKPIVTGFSQGGILSFTIAVLHPESVRAVFPIGGYLATPLLPKEWPATAAKPRIHAFHGTADDVVAIAGARISVRRLKDVGLDAELTEYPGVAHTIAAEERRDVVQAIEAAVGTP